MGLPEARLAPAQGLAAPGYVLPLKGEVFLVPA